MKSSDPSYTTEYPLLANGPIHQNHGFALLGALSARHPFLHGREDLQIAPIYGKRSEDGEMLFISFHSVLRIRGLTAEEAQTMAYSQINMQGTTLQMGEPVNVPFQGFPNLAARMVVLSRVWDAETKRMIPFTKTTTEEQFLLTVVRKVGDPTVGIQQLRKRSVQINGHHFIGWSIRLSGLTLEKSLEVQARGIGKYTSMGCGYFMGF